MNSFKLLLPVLTVVSMALPAFAAGHFSFYEGNGGNDDKLGADVFDDKNQDFDLDHTDSNPLKIKDDEAKSVVIHNVRPGTKLAVFKDSKGRTEKGDWTEILVKQDVPEYTVNSFEKSYEDNVVKVSYTRQSGHLDGDVSHITVSMSPIVVRPTEEVIIMK